MICAPVKHAEIEDGCQALDVNSLRAQGSPNLNPDQTNSPLPPESNTPKLGGQI